MSAFSVRRRLVSLFLFLFFYLLPSLLSFIIVFVLSGGGGGGGGDDGGRGVTCVSVLRQAPLGEFIFLLLIII